MPCLRKQRKQAGQQRKQTGQQRKQTGQQGVVEFLFILFILFTPVYCELI